MRPQVLLVLVPALIAAGCGAGGVEASGETGLPSFRVGVDHPYFFPLVPGRVSIYEGDDEGVPRHEEVRTLRTPRDIAGVACTGLQQEVYVGGALEEVTTEWYAQDQHGNVWKFGEESFEASDEGFVRTEDSWLAGENGGTAWLAYPNDPLVGERIVGDDPEGPDVYEFVSLTDTVVVPAGAFENCHRIVENPDDPEDTDIILYAAGVGLVSEQSARGRIDLVTMTQE